MEAVQSQATAALDTTQWPPKRREECHRETWACAGVRGGLRADSQLCHQVEFTQLVGFLRGEGKGVSIGLHSTGHEPEGPLRPAARKSSYVGCRLRLSFGNVLHPLHRLSEPRARRWWCGCLAGALRTGTHANGSLHHTAPHRTARPRRARGPPGSDPTDGEAARPFCPSESPPAGQACKSGSLGPRGGPTSTARPTAAAPGSPCRTCTGPSSLHPDGVGDRLAPTWGAAILTLSEGQEGCREGEDTS